MRLWIRARTRQITMEMRAIVIVILTFNLVFIVASSSSSSPLPHLHLCLIFIITRVITIIIIIIIIIINHHLHDHLSLTLVDDVRVRVSPSSMPVESPILSIFVKKARTALTGVFWAVGVLGVYGFRPFGVEWGLGLWVEGLGFPRRNSKGSGSEAPDVESLHQGRKGCLFADHSVKGYSQVRLEGFWSRVYLSTCFYQCFGCGV